MLETEKELSISLVQLQPKFSLSLERRMVFIIGKIVFLLQKLLAIAVIMEVPCNNSVLITAAVDVR